MVDSLDKKESREKQVFEFLGKEGSNKEELQHHNKEDFGNQHMCNLVDYL